jgi:muramoyltetrapeptide carboxypeptidase
MIIPTPLKLGDTIAVLSLASPPNKEKVERGIRYLINRGYKVVQAPNIYTKNKYLAFTKEEQVKDLEWAFRNPEIKAIISTRGGYGTHRYLDLIDYQLIKSNPKWLIGYSDITALSLALMEKSNLVSISGPMVAVEMAAEEGISNVTENHFWPLVENNLIGQHLSVNVDGNAKTFQSGSAEGILIGGCLSLFNNLAGTPYFPSLKNSIVVLEDVGENVQHVDRMLSQFKLMGMFDAENGINGLILGHFIDAWEHADLNDFTLNELLHDIVGDYKIPIITNASYGHQKIKSSLPLGAKIRLNTHDFGLEII